MMEETYRGLIQDLDRFLVCYLFVKEFLFQRPQRKFFPFSEDDQIDVTRGKEVDI